MTKLCKDCKYYEGIYCSSPNNGLNFTDGKPRIRFANVNRVTSTNFKYKTCGSNADWFESKETGEVTEVKSWVNKLMFWRW